MKRILLPLLPLLALVVGCSGDDGPEPVKKYNTYSDPVLRFSVRYPDGWASSNTTGTVLFLTSSTLGDAFARYDPGEMLGAKIEVHAAKADPATMADSIKAFKSTFSDQGIFKDDQVQLGGQPATRVTYAFPVGETEFKAERYYVATGNAITYLETAVFGNYAAYNAIFDSVKAGFKPAEIASASSGGGGDSGTVQEIDLVAPPSAEMKTYAGSHFSLSYPSNFNQMTSSGGKLASVKFIGDRVDSYVQVDVNESTNPLQQHADLIKGKFGAGKSTTIGGQPGFVFNFKGGSNATGRIYLTKTGNKLFQITVTWFTPQANLYLPAFDKVIASFKGK